MGLIIKKPKFSHIITCDLCTNVNETKSCSVIVLGREIHLDISKGVQIKHRLPTFADSVLSIAYNSSEQRAFIQSFLIDSGLNGCDPCIN